MLNVLYNVDFDRAEVRALIGLIAITGAALEDPALRSALMKLGENYYDDGETPREAA
jgi:hypothetical protein